MREANRKSSEAKKIKDKDGLTVYDKWFEKFKKTTIERHDWNFKDDESKKEYDTYLREVVKLSNRNIKPHSDRGKYNQDMQLDHIFPINKGFRYNIPVNIMADVTNLRYILGKINKNKHGKICEIPLIIKEFLKKKEIELQQEYIYLINEEEFYTLPLKFYKSEDVIFKKIK